MTEKQMISTLKGLTFGTVVGSKGVEALELAIKALSQEPCDAISRETLIAKLTELIKTSRSTIEIKAKLIPMIQNMPTVTQKSDVLDKIRDEIERLHYHPKLDFIKNDEVVDMVLDIIDRKSQEKG